MNGPGSSCAALNDAKESKIETTTTTVVLLNRKLVSIQFKPLLCTCDDTLIAICCSWLCYYYYIFVIWIGVGEAACKRSVKVTEPWMFTWSLRLLIWFYLKTIYLLNYNNNNQCNRKATPKHVDSDRKRMDGDSDRFYPTLPYKRVTE